MSTSEIISLEINTTIIDEQESSPKKEVGITKPCSFNGDWRRVKEFIRECNVYLNINENIYKTDKLKVAFVLLLMNKKEAPQWKAHFINKITRPDMKLDFPKFKDFLVLIQYTFKPADQAGEAMNKLELLWQGNRAVEEMITEFHLLCAEAELEELLVLDNRHLIKLFANCLNSQLKKRILFGEVVPKTISGWIKKAIQYDSNYCMGQTLMNMDNRGKKPQKKNWDDKDPNAMDTSIGALTEKEKTALMKIRACFQCKKTGHLLRDFPDKNKNSSGQQTQVQVPKKFTPKDITGISEVWQRKKGQNSWPWWLWKKGIFKQGTCLDISNPFHMYFKCLSSRDREEFNAFTNLYLEWKE